MRALPLLPAILLLAGCAAGSYNPGTSEDDPEASTLSGSITVVADGLFVPWDITALPDGDLLVTERSGTLRRIGKTAQSFPVQGVRAAGEGGLLGLTLHPQFAQNHWLYLYLTAADGNRVERYRFDGDGLTDRREILSGIPAGANHDGGRIAFGPDGLLYVTTGDAGRGDRAQDTGSLAGKILRLRDDGSVPADNPFGNAVYAYGLRNPQGIAWDNEGRLWATDHGRSGLQSGYDEINLIVRGGNFGWPVIQGPEHTADMTAPVVQSGPDTTWAPASILVANGRIFFAGLRGEAIYELVFRAGENAAPAVKVHFQNAFGRIRTLRFSDGALLLTTSNRDGRGDPADGDDRILRIPFPLLQ